MKKIIIAATTTLIALTNTLKAQMPYNFAASKSAYQPLTTGTKLNDTTTWDDEVYKLAIPFPFKLNNKTITHFYIQGGEIAMSDTAGAADAIPFMNADIIDRGVADTVPVSKSPIRYKVDGNAGSRILKLEIANAGFADEFNSDTTTDDFFNLQIWVYEGSNVFEMRYGANSIADFNTYFPVLGMMTGFAKGLDMNQGAFDKIYILSGDPASPDIDSMTTTSFTYGLSSFPDSGTVYRFTPKPTSIADKPYVQEMKLYPTRCSDVLMVENPNKINSTYRVLSLAGSIMRYGDIDAGINKIDVSNLPSGMYLVRFDYNAGFETQKFLKM